MVRVIDFNKEVSVKEKAPENEISSAFEFVKKEQEKIKKLELHLENYKENLKKLTKQKEDIIDAKIFEKEILTKSDLVFLSNGLSERGVIFSFHSGEYYEQTIREKIFLKIFINSYQEFYIVLQIKRTIDYNTLQEKLVFIVEDLSESDFTSCYRGRLKGKRIDLLTFECENIYNNSSDFVCTAKDLALNKIGGF